MPAFPNLPTRLTQLLRIFDEVRKPFSAVSSPKPSEDLMLCTSGRISPEEYLRRRIEISLARVAPHLDAGDLGYVRAVCFEYLREDFMHTGLFRSIVSRLRNPDISGQMHIGCPSEGGALVNQNENAAKKTDGEIGSEDLQALKRGEITADEYLERRLERQIEVLNLGRLLTEEERNKMRAVIRENFLKSPFFRHYTNAMTGRSDEDPS
jgi:hypothetical protein